MDIWIYVYIDRWTNGWMDEWIWMDGWMDWWVDGWIDASMDNALILSNRRVVNICITMVPMRIWASISYVIYLDHELHVNYLFVVLV